MSHVDTHVRLSHTVGDALDSAARRKLPMLLESLEAARSRGAEIHAEVIGGAVNSGGQRLGGTMTAPSPAGIRRCLRAALADGDIAPDEIDAISGHLSATGADAGEVLAWADALELTAEQFPVIFSTKSLIGHALSAAGSIESVAALLMLRGGFVQPSINCEDLHPDLAPFEASIPREPREMPELRVLAKASFGFGDVNACLVIRRFVD